ncbi:MAG: hypothetical protein AB7U79_05185 [Candidatus Izemoplasmatales bacterium]
MKRKIFLLTALVLSTFLFVINQSCKVNASAYGPGFYFEQDESGSAIYVEPNENNENDFALIGTGFVRQINSATVTGELAPYDTLSAPIYLELYLPLSEFSSNIPNFSQFVHLYGRIIGSTFNYYDDKFFSIIYVSNYSEIDFYSEGLYLSYIDIAYYTYTSDYSFFDSELINAADYSDQYDIYEFIAPTRLFVDSVYKGMFFVFKQVHSDQCSLLITQKNPIEYGFISSHYIVHYESYVCGSTTYAVINIKSEDDYSFSSSWDSGYLSTLIILDLE